MSSTRQQELGATVEYYVPPEHATRSEVEGASADVVEAGLDAGEFVEHFALTPAMRYERAFPSC